MNGRGDGRGTWNEETHFDNEPSFGELLKRLTGDMGTLVSQEVNLAKAEMRESARVVAKGGAKLGVAMTFAIAGTVALTAFLVIAFGGALDNYWLAALIVGAVELGLGMILAKSAIGSMTSPDMKPAETMKTLREGKQWAGNEARDLKREITSANSTANGR
jgi:uncharacterized membrane protein YqjE